MQHLGQDCRDIRDKINMRHQMWRAGMHRSLLIFALLALLPAASSSQRHGRADSVQNYIKSMRPFDPQLALNLETEHKWIYFHATDLKQMKRTAISVTNPITNAISSYEGISLYELVPDPRSKYVFEIFKDSWAFLDKRAVSSESGVRRDRGGHNRRKAVIRREPVLLCRQK